MKLNQTYIDAYERSYKRTKATFIIMYAIIYVAFVLNPSIAEQVFTIYINCYLISFIALLAWTRSRFDNNINKVVLKYKNDFRTNIALQIYSGLLNKRFRWDIFWVLYGYLMLLLDTCQFEKFEEIYKKNRKSMRSIFMISFLKRLILELSALKDDKKYYQKILSKYHFSRFRGKKGELSGIRSKKRFRDESMEIYQLYETKQYEKAIEKINSMHIDNMWDNACFFAEKQKCLFHLKQEYRMLGEEDSEYLYYRKLKTLLDTGKEYSYENAERILLMMNEDIKVAKRTAVLLLAIGIVGSILCFN